LPRNSQNGACKAAGKSLASRGKERLQQQVAAYERPIQVDAKGDGR
jgi:hypothetical protein